MDRSCVEYVWRARPLYGHRGGPPHRQTTAWQERVLYYNSKQNETDGFDDLENTNNSSSDSERSSTDDDLKRMAYHAQNDQGDEINMPQYSQAVVDTPAVASNLHETAVATVLRASLGAKIIPGNDPRLFEVVVGAQHAQRLLFEHGERVSPSGVRITSPPCVMNELCAAATLCVPRQVNTEPGRPVVLMQFMTVDELDRHEATGEVPDVTSPPLMLQERPCLLCMWRAHYDLALESSLFLDNPRTVVQFLAAGPGYRNDALLMPGASAPNGLYRPVVRWDPTKLRIVLCSPHTQRAGVPPLRRVDQSMLVETSNAAGVPDAYFRQRTEA